MHANLRPTSSKAGPIWKLSIQLALTLATSTGFILLGTSPNALAAQSNNDTPPSHAKPIDYVQAVFSVQYGSKETAGENLLNIKSEGNQYEVNFDLDHWMLSSNQYARFEMDDCTVQPEFYQDTNKRPFKSKETQKLEFDWAHHQAVFSNKDDKKTFTFKDNKIGYDPLSFFFEARCALMDGETQFTYPVIRKGKMKDQTYKISGQELVQTPLGDFEALVVERERENPKRQTRLYVAPELDYLLVKIEHQESAMLRVVATLKEMDYKLKEAANP